MEQRSNNLSGREEIPRTKFHYCAHKSLPLVPMLSLMNPLHFPPCNFLI
jgi:hypothetical protein